MTVKIVEYLISYKAERGFLFTSSDPKFMLTPSAIRVIRNLASWVKQIFCSKYYFFIFIFLSVSTLKPPALIYTSERVSL